MTNAPTESPPDQHGPADPESVSVPTELSSDGTKLVYLYLQVTGESTLTELNQSLEMKSISLLPILNTLMTKDLVDRDGNSYLPTAA
jgi:predicted transcriptional regulator